MQEKEDFRQLYLRQADMVYRICLLYLKNRTDTEDAVQNIFLKAWEKQVYFKDILHEKAWFITVTGNYCKDVLKSSWKRKRVCLEDIETLDNSGLIGLSGLKTTKEDRSEMDDTVLDAVMELPARHREVLYLYYFEGYAVKEMAAILNRKESTIQSQLAAARKKLEKILVSKGLHL